MLSHDLQRDAEATDDKGSSLISNPVPTETNSHPSTETSNIRSGECMYHSDTVVKNPPPPTPTPTSTPTTQPFGSI